MSGGPRLRSMNVADPESRPVLVPAGNKARSVTVSRKPATKPLKKAEIAELQAEPEVEANEEGLPEAEANANEQEEKKKKKKAPSPNSGSPRLSPSLSTPSVLRRQEMLLRSNLSLNASCSSDASTDSFCSRASTGRIGRAGFRSRGRRQGVSRPEKIAAKMEKNVLDVASPALVAPLELVQGKRRCAWVTPNTDPCYAAFHDEEWGLPVHDDRRLFELLVLSGALAELTWPTILSKRQTFREVFMDFDPVEVSKLNEKKLIAPGSTASSLLSEPKLRAIIENARQIPKIIDEFGSFDNYCWSFVNHKPIVSRFRYHRQVPVKTPKADFISKDLVRRGFRSVGPTVIYTFMQAAGITNDHLIGCFRFEECAASVASKGKDEGDGDAFKAHCKVEDEVDISSDVAVGIDLELSRAVDELSIS